MSTMRKPTQRKRMWRVRRNLFRFADRQQFDVGTVDLNDAVVRAPRMLVARAYGEAKPPVKIGGGIEVLPPDISLSALAASYEQRARETRSAAHELASKLRPHLRSHHLQPGVGHYGVFSGSKWAGQIYPVVRNMIRSAH